MDLVQRLAPDPTPDELLEALRIGQAYLHELGITAWTDAHVDRSRLATYLRGEQTGLLTGRVTASLEWDAGRGLDQVDDLLEWGDVGGCPDRVRATVVKIFQDGVIENRTAGMLEPYLDDHGRPGTDHGQRRAEPDVFAAARHALRGGRLPGPRARHRRPRRA